MTTRRTTTNTDFDNPDVVTRRLETDADRLVTPPHDARVRAIMNSIQHEDATPNTSAAPSTDVSIIGRVGRFAPLAIAAAFVLVAAPILFLAISAPRATTTASPQQQAAAIRSAFDAFDNVRLPVLPPAARDSFAKAMALASPDAVRTQTKSIIEDSRRFAERLTFPIPLMIRSPQDDAPAPSDENSNSTSMNGSIKSTGAA